MNGANMALRMPMKMKRRLSLTRRNKLATVCNVGKKMEEAPFHQILPPSFTYKLLPHLSPLIEQVSHQAEPQIPLQRLGEGIRAKADIPPPRVCSACRQRSLRRRGEERGGDK